jgi:hypothetical protein
MYLNFFPNENINIHARFYHFEFFKNEIQLNDDLNNFYFFN